MPKARDYNPAVKQNAKWYPYDLAGQVGQPQVGDIYYVDANSGSDSAGGKSWEDAFKTLGTAYTACTTNNYDIIVVAPNGTSGTSEASAITWSKNHISVVGATAPVPFSQRARILASSSVSPLITVSGQGNRFVNLQFATYEDNNELVKVTGNRNYFYNVHFAGMGNATAGDDADGRCLHLSGAEECLFEDCTLGLDTVARSTSNATVEIADASTRNTFRNCRFIAYADNSGALFVKAASAADADRFQLFEGCIFHNAGNSSATTMTVAMDLHASLGGSIILFNSWLFGATDWADEFTNVEVAGGAQATSATAGLMTAGA